MGEIRYHILRRVNDIRARNNKQALNIHEDNSNAAQKHAQYLLEEMVKDGEQRFREIGHHNPYYNGEYIAENLGEFNFQADIFNSLEHIIDFMLLCMIKDRDAHLANIIGDYTHLGAEIAISNEPKLVVLVQRFS